MKLVRAGLIGALLVGLGATPAQAHLLRHRDPDDVAGHLDLRAVRLDRGQDHFMVKFATHDNFSDSDLVNGHFEVFVDSRGGKPFDFRMRVDLYEGLYPRCMIYDRVGYDRGGVDAEKSPDSITCHFPESNPFHANKHLRWRVESSWGSSIDRAPGRGWFAH